LLFILNIFVTISNQIKGNLELDSQENEKNAQKHNNLNIKIKIYEHGFVFITKKSQ
jgi:hypothetical protein